jgi:hypothetical protein
MINFLNDLIELEYFITKFIHSDMGHIAILQCIV